MKFLKTTTLVLALIFLLSGHVAHASITAPTDISGLKLWLDANDLDGDGSAANNPSNGAAVATWVDKSGAGNNATQSTSAKRPTFVTSGLNSKPTVNFSGSDNSQQMVIGDTSTTTWSFLYNDTTGSSVFIVVKSLAASAGDATDYILYSDNWQFYNYANGNQFAMDGAAANSYPSDYYSSNASQLANQFGFNTHSIINGSSTSTGFEHFVEGGTLVKVVNHVGFPFSGTVTETMRLGGSGGGTYSLDGDVAEVIMYNKALTDTQRKDVECYLETKWGLSTNACANATPPTLTNFTSPLTNGTYGVGQAVTITATFSKLVASSTMTVTLDTGRTVVLNKPFQNKLFGYYIPNVGESSSDLNVTAISAVNVTDINGNNITSLSVPSAGNNLAGQKDIVITTNTTQVPVIIIAGQSNALGRADLANITRTDGTPSTKIIDQNLTGFSTLQQGVNQSYSNPTTQFGPEMGIAYKYKDETPSGTPSLYIIKVPMGNTFLKPYGNGYFFWDPNTAQGIFDTNMIGVTRTAFNQIKTAGYTPNVLGVYWLQGENDAIFQNYADEYQARLTDLIAQTRTQLGFANLPFAIGKIVSPEAGTNTIRAAEAAVVAADSHACLVNLDDLTLNVDGVHFDAASQMTMGARVWNAFKGCNSVAPAVSSKVIRGSTLTLTFDKALNTDRTVPATSAFAVRINGTPATVSSVATTSTTQLALTISPAAVGTDTVTVAYTVPVNNSIQDWAANQVVGFTASAVTNSTLDLSSVAAGTITSSSARITWTSSQLASSIVDFGLSSSYGTSTTQADTSPRVTSHTVNLSGLAACTDYHYRVRSIDSSAVSASSADGLFTTTGCTGNASVTASTTSSVTVASGGTITLSGTSITVPAAFTTSTSSASFQIKALDADAFFLAAGTPSGVNKVGSNVVNLKALSDATTTISTFAQPISVTLSYNPSDISGLTESSLTIYRYDGSSWYALSSCTVNTGAHTVTCLTSNFSDFGIFGTAEVAAAANSNTSSGGGGSSAPTSPTNWADYFIFSALKKTPVVLATAISTTTQKMVPVSYQFKKNLYWGMPANEDIRRLQIYLNTHGYPVAATGPGSLGKENTIFGPATYAALVKYQKAHAKDIFPGGKIGNGLGVFGLKTMAVVNAGK